MSWVAMTVLSFLGLILAAGPTQAVTPASPEDAFIDGYAAALLEREFKLTVSSLAVSRGVIMLDAADLAGADRERVPQQSGVRCRFGRGWPANLVGTGELA
jgi:hypothetical protein